VNCSTVFRMLDPKALDAAFGRLTATLVAALAKGGVNNLWQIAERCLREWGEKLAPNDGLGLRYGSLDSRARLAAAMPVSSVLATGVGFQIIRFGQASTCIRHQGPQVAHECAAVIAAFVDDGLDHPTVAMQRIAGDDLEIDQPDRLKPTHASSCYRAS